MIGRLVERWLALDDAEQVHVHGLLLCGALFLFHYAFHAWWFVEDAAISFAFARNAALGEGFVAYPGGEPVEGFSNPSWTLLLAFFRLLGLSPFVSAKLLGAVLGLATLPLAWAWARRLMGASAGRWPLFVPLLLAVSPHFTLWCASGLENPLVTFLIALAALWLLDEVASGGAPRSAIPLFALAISRPEAPLYVAVAGLTALAFAVARRGPAAAWAWAWRWGLAVAAPLAAWHALRVGYFAWEWPNTYYAKLGADDRFQPLRWSTAGWSYLRRWALHTGQGFLLPIYVLALTGGRGRRLWAGIAITAALWLTWLPGLGWPHQLVASLKIDEPSWMVAFRVGALALAALALPLLGLRREGDAARTLAWTLCVTGLFFALYSGGDWMAGFRWINPVVVPLSVLFVDGVRALSEALPRHARTRRTLTVLALGVPLVAGVVHGVMRVAMPEIGPFDVRRRVVYMESVAARLDLDRPVQLEVDMGAQLWWAPFDHVDLAGLVDVPIGHHRWEQPFIRQYVFQERAPHFAHVHGHWERKSRMGRHPEWKGYLEIPGVPVSQRTLHMGNHIRRDLFVTTRWPGTDARRAAFRGGPTLVGLDVPMAEAAPGHALFVTLGWRRPSQSPPFRAWLFLASEHDVHVWELPPGYDFTDSTRWRSHDVVLGRHSLPIPSDLAPGTWDLGLVVVGAGPRGMVLPPSEMPEGATIDQPRFARGELRWPDAVTIVPEPHARAAADAEVAVAVAAAESRDCEAAEAAWERARRRLAPRDRWQEAARRTLARPIARCYAAWAEAIGGHDAVPVFARAHAWDHRDVVVRAVGGRLADALIAEADAAVTPEDTYRALSAALGADPRRTWVRRRAESARDALLGLADE